MKYMKCTCGDINLSLSGTRTLVNLGIQMFLWEENAAGARLCQDVDEVLFNALLDTCCRLKAGD